MPDSESTPSQLRYRRVILKLSGESLADGGGRDEVVRRDGVAQRRAQALRAEDQRGVDFGDANGDGRDDLAVRADNWSEMVTYFSTGHGVFERVYFTTRHINSWARS